MPPRSAARVYSAHLEDDERHCRSVHGESFEEAAVAFLAEAPALGEEEAVVIVTDMDDGRRQCFRIDLASGEVGPCGP